MSLGFNMNRPSSSARNMSNSLLGSVTASSMNLPTASTAFSRPSKNQNRSIPSTSSPPPVPRQQTDGIAQRRIEYLETQLKRVSTTLQEMKSSSNSIPAVKPTLPDEVHAVYGVATQTIQSITSDTLAQKGDVIKLVYPMKKDKEKVTMRMVLIDSNTAQLSYQWVTVFETINGAPVRYVTDFSHFPRSSTNSIADLNHIPVAETSVHP